MTKTLFHGDAEDLLDNIRPVDCIFMDPPDNLNLGYDGYNDKMLPTDYYRWLEVLILKSLRVSRVVWISYYWEHDLELKFRVRNILCHRHPSYEAKTFLWRYTFGQYNDNDCGSGFRFLLRLARMGTTWNVDPIRVPSRRMEIGDSRAAGPRVPDDVWEFPRIVAPNAERRDWHPTQHPQGLMKRIYDMTPGDRVVDLFGGTGTTFRSTTKNALISEISPKYVNNISLEHGVQPIHDPALLGELWNGPVS